MAMLPMPYEEGTLNVTNQCTNITNISKRLVLQNNKALNMELVLSSGLSPNQYGVAAVFEIPSTLAPQSQGRYILNMSSLAGADLSKLLYAYIDDTDHKVYVVMTAGSTTTNEVYITGSWIIL